LIAHWPKGIAHHGELRHQPAHVIDIVPTLLAIAGGQRPSQWEGAKVPPAPGVSIAPAFEAQEPLPRKSLWWLHEGNRALRQGDWKVVAAKGKPWELYDLANDRSESFDLAAKHPNRLQEMVTEWETLATEMGKQLGQ
jgi:arylsulfatase